MEQLKVIGYYICDIIDTPDWLQGVGNQVLSVSGCIGQQHPRWECFLGGWLKGESKQYQADLRLNEQQYQIFQQTANRLFDCRQIDIDSRFLHLSDAMQFARQFCPDSLVVSVSTLPDFFRILQQQLQGSNSHGQMSGAGDSSQLLGYDILGWDISGFHSFLCNELQKGLPARFNQFGLLENRWEEVTDCAGQIQGLGEPVEWIPCRLGLCR